MEEERDRERENNVFCRKLNVVSKHSSCISKAQSTIMANLLGFHLIVFIIFECFLLSEKCVFYFLLENMFKTGNEVDFPSIMCICIYALLSCEMIIDFSCRLVEDCYCTS